MPTIVRTASELTTAFNIWISKMIILRGQAFFQDGMYQAYAQGWADGLTAQAERAQAVKR